ncbi:MAG TPA: rhomboid family intramembrane serine protease [Blastocatellia bacterium]|nr:rhomboid family intramembrane serine protease [Blastocatellia bacterium]
MNQPTNQPGFRSCPNCGNPTPADNPDCVHCGFRSLASVLAERERVNTVNFVRALFTRASPFTFIFVGLNVGIFILMWLSGGMSLMSADDDVLIGFGAKFNPLIDGQHQYWRLVTCIFLHIGFAHLIMNNYALWILGQEIEQIYGSSRFVLLYLGAGMVGSLSSYMVRPESLSAGASGAIFGLFGVMGTFAFRYRKEIPAALRRDIIRRIIPIILINLAFGFSVRFVDNSAHIGGLLSGIALALVVPYKRPGEVASSRVWKVAEIVCLAIIAISFIEAFRHYDGPRPSLANLRADPEKARGQEIGRIKDAENQLVDSLNLFNTIVKNRDKSADLSPALQAAERGIRDLEELRLQDPSVSRLKEVLAEQREIIERHGKANPKNWDQTKAEEDALVEKAKRYKLVVDD